MKRPRVGTMATESTCAQLKQIPAPDILQVEVLQENRPTGARLALLFKEAARNPSIF